MIGPKDNFKPSPQRILTAEDTEILCSTNVVPLLSQKPLAILDRGKQNNHFGPDKIFPIIYSQSL